MFHVFYKRVFHKTEDNPLVIFPSFGALNQTTFDINIKRINADRFFLGIMNQDEYLRIWNPLQNYSNVCNSKKVKISAINSTFIKRNYTIWNTDLNSSIYYPIVINCNSSSINIECEISFNAYGSFLDSRASPFEFFHLLIIFFPLLFVFVALYTYLNKYFFPLSSILLVLSNSLMIFSSIAYKYIISSMKQNGKPDFVFFVIIWLSNSLYYIEIMFLSCGFGFLHNSIHISSIIVPLIFSSNHTFSILKYTYLLNGITKNGLFLLSEISIMIIAFLFVKTTKPFEILLLSLQRMYHCSSNNHMKHYIYRMLVFNYFLLVLITIESLLQTIINIIFTYFVEHYFLEFFSKWLLINISQLTLSYYYFHTYDSEILRKYISNDIMKIRQGFV